MCAKYQQSFISKNKCFLKQRSLYNLMFFRNLNAKNSTAKIGKFPGILINDSLLLYNITKTFML